MATETVIPDWALSSPQAAWEFATLVLNNRFPKGEYLIAQDPYCAYCYALYRIKGRFIAAEPVIAPSEHACYYAIHVIRGRWLEAEPAIVCSDRAGIYFDYFRDSFTKREQVLWLLKL
jgi:hypothetical protein